MQISGWKKQKEFHQYFDNTVGGRFMVKEEKIILYSTKSCPRCSGLKRTLNDKGIDYEVCEDVDKMASLGISSIPVLEINGELLSSAESIRWANAR